MGSAAELFYNANQDSDTLHSRITPAVEQQEDHQARWEDLAEFLKLSLKERTGLPVQTCLQGSCKLGTQIRPWSKDVDYGIDLGVYFEWDGEAEGGDYGPKELKGFVQQALIEYHSADKSGCSGVDEPKERCCRIRFQSDLHIDVSCYHLDPVRDSRSLATESQSWEESDPKALYKWFEIAAGDELQLAQWRRQVQYLKIWVSLNLKENDEIPSSLLLTVLAADTIMCSSTKEIGDDQLFFEVVDLIGVYLCDTYDVENPVDEYEDVNLLSGPGTEDFIADLADLKKICERAVRETNKAKAAEIWAEAFHDFFPMPEDIGAAVVPKS